MNELIARTKARMKVLQDEIAAKQLELQALGALLTLPPETLKLLSVPIHAVANITEDSDTAAGTTTVFPPAVTESEPANNEEKKRSPRVTGNPRPAVVIPAVIEILRANGYPMSRRKIHEALAERGLYVDGAQPIKALGTMLWRASDKIVGLEGGGYWIKGEEPPTIEQSIFNNGMPNIL